MADLKEKRYRYGASRGIGKALADTRQSWD
jgi:hypothetical protein